MSESEAAPNQGSAEPSEAAIERPLSLLAAESYRENFHGEVPEKLPEQEVTDEQSTAKEETETAEEITEVAEVEESEEVPISSIQELIEHNKYDPEWFNTLKVPVKVDGTTAEATVSDLVKSYQIGEAAEKRLEDAKSKAKAITSELAQKSEALEGQFAVVASLVENLESKLTKRMEASDLKHLRKDDPAEYAARMLEFDEERKGIEQIKRSAIEAYQKTRQSTQEQFQYGLQERLQAEATKLVEKIPEWQDKEKAAAGKKRLAEYLLSQGFSQEDVMSAADHRLIVMSRKAMLYDEQQSTSNPARKKVVSVPKVIRPGAPKPKEQINREKQDALKARLRQSGSIDDAFALLKASRN